MGVGIKTATSLPRHHLGGLLMGVGIETDTSLPRHHLGGLLMGVGIETSSHKYGLFNDNVVAAEVVLSDGALMKCSLTENRDLFDALPWSYGTLGLLVSVTLKVSHTTCHAMSLTPWTCSCPPPPLR